MNFIRFSRHALILGTGLGFSSLALACSSCGCTLSSDWDSQGFAVGSGFRIDLRYDYLNQSQLRSGTGTVNRAGIELPPEREIEQQTKNHYTTLGLDYSPNKDWGINAQIPYIDRSHSTIAEGDSDISSSKTSAIGDVRLLVRYQGLTTEKNLGLQFGLKLPTGSIHDRFKSGPQAGNDLDRGLQAGTGTTDLLLGLYHFGTLNKNWDYFAQGQVQVALDSRDGYKPGSGLNLNAGLRYVANDTFVPQIQINGKTGKRDSGENADRDNSGGTLVYLSPGATLAVGKNLKLYGFVQVPLYQNVNGYQLAPRATVSVGMRYSM